MSRQAGGGTCFGFGLGVCVFNILGCCRRGLESKREGSMFVKKEYWALRRVR